MNDDLRDAAIVLAVMLLREAQDDPDPEIRNAARVLAERAERRYTGAHRVALNIERKQPSIEGAASDETLTDTPPTGDAVIGLQQVSVALSRLKLG